MSAIEDLNITLTMKQAIIGCRRGVGTICSILEEACRNNGMDMTAKMFGDPLMVDKMAMIVASEILEQTQK